MSIVSSDTELDKNLTLVTSTTGAYLQRTDQDASNCLPGQARASLNNAHLQKYLRKELTTPNLDKIARYLWLVFTPDHARISPLHFQAARGRRVIVVEDVNLHLVWLRDRIFIKPIPAYLLSSAFWRYIGKTDTETWKAAAGFLRTYAYLISYEIDFRKAQSTELGLIPISDGKNPITYERFAQFIAPFVELEDEQVVPRYRHGELRLSRLNWFTSFMMGKLTYHHIHDQWNQFLGKLLAPFLTVFVLLTTALTAMQVELAVQSTPQGSKSWGKFSSSCRWVSVLSLIFVFIVSVVAVAVVLFTTVQNQVVARKLRLKRLKQKKAEAELTSCVV